VGFFRIPLASAKGKVNVVTIVMRTRAEKISGGIRPDCLAIRAITISAAS